MGFYRIAIPEESQKTVTLYHGTVLAFAKNIISEGIKVNRNEGHELDFGSGLYFADFPTAKVLAIKKAKANKKSHRTGEYVLPVVLPLDVDINYILNNEKTLIFTRKDREWLDYVFKTRESKTIPYGYDASMIIGPMADGAVDSIMDIYRRHPNRFTKFIVCINFMFFSGFTHMQYVVKKQQLCDNDSHIKIGLPIIVERRYPYDQ